MRSKLVILAWSRAMKVIHTHDPKRGNSNACSRGKFLGNGQAMYIFVTEMKVALKLIGIWI